MIEAYQTVESFLRDVRSEIRGIKENATNEEKSKLDYSLFDGDSRGRCIYGLMTGLCTSARAKELHRKSISTNIYTPFSNLELIVKSDSFNPGESFTPLEVYLFTPNGIKYAEHIIKFIKGEVKHLKIK